MAVGELTPEMSGEVKPAGPSTTHPPRRLEHLDLAPKMRRRAKTGISRKERPEEREQKNLIGQLKAAEARNRLRVSRLRYQENRLQDVSHMSRWQPGALQEFVYGSSLKSKGTGYGAGTPLQDLTHHASCISRISTAATVRTSGTSASSTNSTRIFKPLYYENLRLRVF